MAVDPPAAVSFADSSAFDSDGEEDATSSSLSTSESGSGSGSGVILGFEDGEIATSASSTGNTPHAVSDELKLDISRIGGRAVFPLPSGDLPPKELLDCPLCANTMVLLVQVYAPLSSEDSVRPLAHPPYPHNLYRDECDRLLYVFGCVKKRCTGVRCLRAARRSKTWARSGAQTRKRKQMEKDAQEEAKARVRASNPFASASGALNPFVCDNPFSSAGGDLGSMIFGSSGGVQDESGHEGTTSAPQLSLPEASSDDAPLEDVESTSEWPAKEVETPCIPAKYLTTSYEHLSSSHPIGAQSKNAQLAKQLGSMSLADGPEPKEAHKGGRGGKGRASSSSESSAGNEAGWSAEAYEIMKVAGVEEIFLAFQERLETSGAADQVVRYERGGQPLPFSAKSGPYQLLFTSAPAPGSSTAVSREAYAPAALKLAAKRYDASCSKVPKCTHCQGNRTFELQLMPHLVSLAERGLNQGLVNGQEQKELGWATVWCFVCTADCLDAAADGEENAEGLDWQGWREEVALVELED